MDRIVPLNPYEAFTSIEIQHIVGFHVLKHFAGVVWCTGVKLALFQELELEFCGSKSYTPPAWGI